MDENSLADMAMPCPYMVSPNAHLSVGTRHCRVREEFTPNPGLTPARVGYTGIHEGLSEKGEGERDDAIE